MATKNKTVEKDNNEYSVRDSYNEEWIAECISFDEIAESVEEYMEDNEYAAGDVNIEIYKLTDISVEIEASISVTVSR